MVGGFAYGLVVALASGNYLSRCYSFANFLLPLAIGLWIAADQATFSTAYRRVTRVLFSVTTVISVYGIVQYVFAPEWDCQWLRGVISEGALSFGRPEPYQIRVFSMLASPGPFGDFMAAMLLVALPQLSIRRPWLLMQLPVWVAAFGLSLDRSGWLVFALGFAIYIALTPRRLSLLVGAGVSAVLVIGFYSLLPAMTGNDAVLTSLNNRLATFSDIDRDRSENDREYLYNVSRGMIADAPFGQGLGIFGTATKIGNPPTNLYIDSGLISRYIELGPPGFALFLGAFGVLGAGLLVVWKDGARMRDAVRQEVSAMAFAIMVSLFAFQVSGEIGGLLMLTIWLTVGLILRGKSQLEVPVVTTASLLPAPITARVVS
jgi:hypothetical protein